jgi:Tfp pilus assembly protein PilF
MATLRMRMGQPAEAERIWRSAREVPREGLQSARVAQAQICQLKDDDAWTLLSRTVAAEPENFEAQFALAVLKRDAGILEIARVAAEAAVRAAPSKEARRAAESLLGELRPKGSGADQ